MSSNDLEDVQAHTLADQLTGSIPSDTLLADDVMREVLCNLLIGNLYDQRFQSLSTLALYLADRFERAKIDKQTANGLANIAILALCEYVNGDRLYVPRPEALARSVRNESLRSEFNGRNYAAIAKRYGISTITVWRALFQRQVKTQRLANLDLPPKP